MPLLMRARLFIYSEQDQTSRQSMATLVSTAGSYRPYLETVAPVVWKTMPHSVFERAQRLKTV